MNISNSFTSPEAVLPPLSSDVASVPLELELVSVEDVDVDDVSSFDPPQPANIVSIIALASAHAPSFLALILILYLLKICFFV